MSTDNELDLSEEESDADFSASEDDWRPEKHHKNQKSSEEDEITDDSTSVTENDDYKPSKVVAKSSRNRNKKLPQISIQKKNVLSKKQREQLYMQCKKKLKSSAATIDRNDTDDESSSSSGDDCLVDPTSINLKSKFFNVPDKNSKQQELIKPNFDCNIGIKLSDSDDKDSDEDNDNFEAVPSTSSSAYNNAKKQTADFAKHHQFSQKLETAKEHLKNFKSNAFGHKDDGEIDVTKLLAQGEDKGVKTSKSSAVVHKKKFIVDSDDSDWEEVEEKTGINDIQFTVGSQENVPKKMCRETDAEAKLRRHINQRKRELQLLMHKVHVLCWIGHGNIINAALNNFSLTKKCLSTFIPSPSCYPKEKTDVTYFEQISKWYKSQMALKDQSIYPKLKKLPPIATSLALQINSKQAICKRDFVLIFIILLRSIGVQCRFIINLPVVPLKPAQSDLCTASNEKKIKSTKEGDTKSKSTDYLASKKGDSKKKSTNSSTATATKSKSSTSKTNTIKDTKNSIESPIISSSSSKRNSLKSKLEKNVKDIMETNKNSNNQLKRKSETESTTKAASYETTPPKKIKLNPQNKIDVADGPSTSKAQSTIVKKNVAVINSPISGRTRKRKAAVDKLIQKPPQLDGGNDGSKSNGKKLKPNLHRLKKKSTKQSDDDDDEDGQTKSPKKFKIETKSTAIEKLKRIDRRVLSTDNDDDDNEHKPSIKSTVAAMDFWVEVYCETDEKWIPINLFKLKINCVDEIRKTLTKPMCYVLAWNNNNTIRDVSARYCPQWNTTTRKMRVDQIWLDKSLKSFVDHTKNAMNAREDRELNRLHLEEPVPKSISELKNHPLYALERHLLKFEAIYPENALTVGFIKSEPIYLRDCVHTLRSREIWVKQARVVKPGQEPYKIVKARPKWDRTLNRMLDPQPLEIFGYWQTQPYEPPTAENGIVPRNAYGNVELFKPEMLPKKTVHLQLPGLNRTCKRMGIDCAQAVVGFDFHSGSSHPTFDGFVVCEEFAEKVVEQWFEDQKEADRKEEEKYNQRVYGNWKKLIKGLLIRERLQKKYNFKDDSESNKKKKKN